MKLNMICESDDNINQIMDLLNSKNPSIFNLKNLLRTANNKTLIQLYINIMNKQYITDPIENYSDDGLKISFIHKTKRYTKASIKDIKNVLKNELYKKYRIELDF